MIGLFATLDSYLGRMTRTDSRNHRLFLTRKGILNFLTSLLLGLGVIYHHRRIGTRLTWLGGPFGLYIPCPRLDRRLLGLAGGYLMVILAGYLMVILAGCSMVILAGRLLGRRFFSLVGRSLVSLGRRGFGDRIHRIIEGKQKVGHRH